MDAASMTGTSSEEYREISREGSHVSCRSAPEGCAQFRAFVTMRAALILPTPRTPEKMYACATRFDSIAFASVRLTCCWPQISLNVCGRYFRAITLYVMESL